MAGGVVPDKTSQTGVATPVAPETAYAPINLPAFVPSETNYYNPYIALNQAYGSGRGGFNPYAAMGGASAPTTPTTAPVANDRAAQLDALSRQYLTQSDAAIAKQKADMVAEAQAAQLAYQRELAAKKAAEDSKAAQMTKLLNQGYRWDNGALISPEEYNNLYPSYSSDGGGFFNGASGGLASLKGFE